MSKQTRNKRKDWQVGLGIKAHKVVYHRPLSGHSGTKCRALREQVTGTHCPYSGHRVPKVSDDFMGTYCESAASLWYFYHIYDTLMILFCKIIRKVSFSYIIMYQIFTPVFNQKDDTLRLFSRKNFFRVRIRWAVNLKSIWYNTL